ncbi:MAG: DUF4364 family protein [Defluviitaleaceae bacterium]|nr:DUF4364 family protein [Defluviitaleaceae bacterium]
MENENTETKLTILYLIDRMDLPLSRSQITDCVLQAELMDYYTLQQSLSEMAEGGYLDAVTDSNTTRYTLTDDGIKMLEYFEKRIPPSVRNKINHYIKNNLKDIKRTFENTATFFPNTKNNEFIVKCGVYEESRVLMELSISVDTREQARTIQNNWKNSAKTLYGDIIQILADER